MTAKLSSADDQWGSKHCMSLAVVVGRVETNIHLCMETLKLTRYSMRYAVTSAFIQEPNINEQVCLQHYP